MEKNETRKYKNNILIVAHKSQFYGKDRITNGSKIINIALEHFNFDKSACSEIVFPDKLTRIFFAIKGAFS